MWSVSVFTYSPAKYWFLRHCEPCWTEHMLIIWNVKMLIQHPGKAWSRIKESCFSLYRFFFSPSHFTGGIDWTRIKIQSSMCFIVPVRKKYLQQDKTLSHLISSWAAQRSCLNRGWKWIVLLSVSILLKKSLNSWSSLFDRTEARQCVSQRSMNSYGCELEVLL